MSEIESENEIRLSMKDFHDLIEAADNEIYPESNLLEDDEIFNSFKD